MSRESRATRVGAVALAAGLAAVGSVLAARADLAANLQIQLVALDTAVGLGLCVAAMVAQGSRGQRGLMLLVGLSWIAGSIWVQAAPAHRGVLALALWTFPTGQLRRWSGWSLFGLCLIVSLGTVSQPGVAALFAAVSAAVIWRSRRQGAAGFPGYPVVCAAGLAALLGAIWLVGPTVDPVVVPVAYGGAMLAIGAAFPFAMRAELRRRESLADTVLGSSELPLLEGLAVTLRRLLGDDGLKVYRWEPTISAYVDGQGARAGEASTGRRLDIADASGPLAVVEYSSAGLDDPSTAQAVATAVRLTVMNLRLQDELRDRLEEMQSARRRMVESIDRERLSMSAKLDQDVERALRDARREVSQVGSDVADREIAEAVERLHEVLCEVSTRMASLVSGAPPVALGGGRLVDAVTELAATCPTPVTVTVTRRPEAAPATETALFYVCSEGLANVTKHARASRILLELDRTADGITVTLTDDGVGGADAHGGGLRGLSDRLAACGGRLQVVSPPGDGTTLTATVPI